METRKNFYRPVTNCKGDDDVFSTAKDKWGPDVTVDPGYNATHWMPSQGEPDPIGEVVVRKGESFWVYRK